MQNTIRWLQRAYGAFMLIQGVRLLRNMAPDVLPRLVPGVSVAKPKPGIVPVRINHPAHPRVSIILPARNEASNIAPCVQTLVGQRVLDTPTELIAVDDDSSDGTSALLDDLAHSADTLSVLHLREKPDGWAGKAYALHRGAQRACGDWLLFTDADTRWQQGAVEALYQYAVSREVDLVSAMPFEVLPTIGERIVVPTLLLTLLLTAQPTDVRKPKHRAFAANGQCLFIRRSAYESIDGYNRPVLRGALLDDSSLAREIKRAGFRLQMVQGHSLLEVQMYPSFRAAWAGWLRSLGASFQEHSRPVGSALFGLLVTLLLVPYGLIIAGLARSLQRGKPSEGLIVGSVALGITISTYGWAIRALRLPYWYILGHPVGVCAQVALLALAWFRRLRQMPVVWKDRAYSHPPTSCDIGSQPSLVRLQATRSALS